MFIQIQLHLYVKKWAQSKTVSNFPKIPYFNKYYVFICTFYVFCTFFVLSHMTFYVRFLYVFSNHILSDFRSFEHSSSYLHCLWDLIQQYQIRYNRFCDSIRSHASYSFRNEKQVLHGFH